MSSITKLRFQETSSSTPSHSFWKVLNYQRVLQATFSETLPHIASGYLWLGWQLRPFGHFGITGVLGFWLGTRLVLGQEPYLPLMLWRLSLWEGEPRHTAILTPHSPQGTTSMTDMHNFGMSTRLISITISPIWTHANVLWTPDKREISKLSYDYCQQI